MVKPVEVPSSESLEPDIVYIGDTVRVIIDRSLLETVKAQGKRLVVSDAIAVEVADDVDAKLFLDVVESISDVIRLRVPENLKSIVTLKSRDVLSITTGRSPLSSLLDIGGFVASIVEPVISTISSMVESISSITGPLSMVEEAKSLLYEERFANVVGFEFNISGGLAKVRSYEGEEALIRIEGKKSKCSYDVDIRDGVLEVDVSGCEAHIEIPRRPLEALEVDMSGGALNIDLSDGVRRLEGSISGGLAELSIAKVKDSTLNIDISGGRLKIRLDYNMFQGVSNIELSLTGGLMELEGIAPEGVRVEVSTIKMGGWTSVTVDDKLKNVKEVKATIKTKVEVTGGLAKVEFKAKRD